VLYDHVEYKPEPVDPVSTATYASAIILVSRGAGVAVRVAAPSPAGVGGDAALLHGGHARAAGAAAPGGVLRERGDPDVGVGDGGGGWCRARWRTRPGWCARRRARPTSTHGRWWTRAVRVLADAPPPHQLDGDVRITAFSGRTTRPASRTTRQKL
jgi:hypothetical protein